MVPRTYDESVSLKGGRVGESDVVLHVVGSPGILLQENCRVIKPLGRSAIRCEVGDVAEEIARSEGSE